MQDWQVGGLVSPDGSAGGLVVHEALQQSINRYALPLRIARISTAINVKARSRSRV
jgi:hypothetical protein